MHLPAVAPAVPAMTHRSGHGELVFSVVAGRTAITRARAESPLKLLCPRSHGEGRWAYIATFGGGLVDGDDIALDVRVERGARALLGTQASTKVYRSPREGARQRLVAHVEDDAFLAAVPDHVACFAGARYAQSARYVLAPGASLITAEILSAGRAACGERWAFARYASRTRIERGGRPIALEAVVLDPTHGDLAPRMRRFDALATVFAFGPRAARIRDAIHAAGARPLAPRADVVLASSAIGDDGAVLRVAGAHIEPVTRCVRDALAGLRDVFGEDPFARKW